MSEKHYPYIGGSFDRIIFDGDGSVWVPEAENATLRELVSDLMPIVCEGCHERLCDMPKEEHPFVECLFDCRMHELGIEVDG